MQIADRAPLRRAGRWRLGGRIIAGVLIGAALIAGGASRPAYAECTTSICGASTCTIVGPHDLDSNCVLDFSGKDVTVAATAVLRNLSGGAFEIRADSLVLKGTLRSPGGWIRVGVVGDFTMSGAGSVIDTATTKPSWSGSVDITAGGKATIGRVVTDGVGDGGDVTIIGKSVAVAGPIHAEGNDGPGGKPSGEGGNISLDAEDDIDITGVVSANAGGAESADGGDIFIDLGGDVRVSSTGVVRAIGVNGGWGGRIWMYPYGGVTMDGKVIVDGNGPNGSGGDIGVYPSKAAGSAGTWSANGGNGLEASGGTIDVTVDFYAGGGAFTSTNALLMRATASGGGRGGDIYVGASGDVTLAGTLDASVGGEGSRGGTIWVGAEAVRATVSVVGKLDVTSSAAATKGFDGVNIVSGCDVVVSGMLKANNHTNGQNAVLYTGSFIVAPTGKLLAGSMGGNLVQCTCTGVDVVKYTCAIPNACTTAPVKQPSATVLPAWRLQPVPVSPCTCFDKLPNGSESGVDCGGSACYPCGPGGGCTKPSDCRDGACTMDTCQPPTCADGVLNQGESATDCGGPCAGCPDGQPCRGGWDCLSKICQELLCRPAGCGNNLKDGAETDVDCGGTSCGPCDDGDLCLAPTDCKSKVCDDTCQAPTCNDGAPNGNETDVDCGGNVCLERCDDGEHCRGDTDCKSKVCDGGLCSAPTCGDRATNGMETDFNCGGGPPCDACGDGQICGGVDEYCKSHVCGDDDVCQPPTCSDSTHNGSETDVDCGGDCTKKCEPDHGCEIPSDCTSGVCPIATKKCAWPACDDMVPNGSETDQDCGGAHACIGATGVARWYCLLDKCRACPVGKHCEEHVDCLDRACQDKTCRMAACDDDLHDGAETDVDCGGPMCEGCDDGQRCKVPTDCKSKVCDGLRCSPHSCFDGVQNGPETGVDCGGGCAGCGLDSPCGTAADCTSGACSGGGRCVCAAHDFTFTAFSSAGGFVYGGWWPGGEATQELVPGCNVTVQLPDRRIDLVCGIANPFRVIDQHGWASCVGMGGDDGDGCGNVSCPIASYGSCCWNRPSCSSALNGSASADFYVHCE